MKKTQFLPCSIYRSDYDSVCNLCFGFKGVYLPINDGFMTIEKIELNKTRQEIHNYLFLWLLKGKATMYIANLIYRFPPE